MVTLKAHILPHPDLQPPGCRGSQIKHSPGNPGGSLRVWVRQHERDTGGGSHEHTTDS
ncbi:hypothetical protein [Shigella flexneri]|uniref:hypothetical protein n=1 Tax=Shigella flexneri TaxID=623 RepID=UPI001597C84A|nr:hypothetical protein [Shigella flexneri]QKW72297.1 hypothetical protein FOB97_23895 [Shigella flexneri]